MKCCCRETTYSPPSGELFRGWGRGRGIVVVPRGKFSPVHTSAECSMKTISVLFIIWLTSLAMQTLPQGDFSQCSWLEKRGQRIEPEMEYVWRRQQHETEYRCVSLNLKADTSLCIITLTWPSKMQQKSSKNQMTANVNRIPDFSAWDESPNESLHNATSPHMTIEQINK